jgi:transcriptional regulator GlxA family with amidase domain
VGTSGVTPAEAVEMIRCELARSLLQTTPLKLPQVAGKTGFGSESALRRALQRRYGVTARALRERFQGKSGGRAPPKLQCVINLHTQGARSSHPAMIE